MIFASLIASLIARYSGEGRPPVDDETPPADDSRPGIADQHRC
jgi:hypothetical protein